MERLLTELNRCWWWLGPVVLTALVLIFGREVRNLIKDEFRWWRKKRDWERFKDE